MASLGGNQQFHVAINFNGNREPKRYAFTLVFLHVFGNIPCLRLRLETRETWRECRFAGVNGRTAPARDPACQLDHLGGFSSFKMCQKGSGWQKNLCPQDLSRFTSSLPGLAGCLFHCVSHHHQGWCQNRELGAEMRR